MGGFPFLRDGLCGCGGGCGGFFGGCGGDGWWGGRGGCGCGRPEACCVTAVRACKIRGGDGWWGGDC